MARVAVHGRSLGSAVAVQLAAQRPVRCVVLTSPFASAVDVARDFYSWLPVAWLMRHPFDSLAHAPRLAMPVLVLAGEADTVVPPEHSRRLAQAWGGTQTLVALRGVGHNDISLHPGYAREVRAFLLRLEHRVVVDVAPPSGKSGCEPALNMGWRSSLSSGAPASVRARFHTLRKR